MKSRKIFIWLTLALMLIILEGFSFLSLKHFESQSPWDFFHEADHYANKVTSSELTIWQKQSGRNYPLGWDTTPSSEFSTTNCLGQKWKASFDQNSSRKNGVNFTQHRISMFGDSFILGQEVNDDETIAHYLSLKTKTSVHNYGVGGHGPDQTYLKFLKTLKIERPEIAIFGVFGSGINRIMNNFRPYTVGMSDIKLGFKPYFEKIQKGYRLVPPSQPLRDKKDLLEALTEKAKSDFWYQYDQDHKPKVALPYSYNLIKMFIARQSHQTWMRDGELFQNEEATAKLDYILKLFIDECRKNNIRPIILFIPTNNDALGFVTNGTYPYFQFIEDLRKKSNVEVLDVLSMKNADWKKFFLKPFFCHASPQGNELMAELIYSQIYLNR